jgi:hypothetical protein
MLTVAGEVKVLDFGTARAQFEDREAVTQALAFGSAAYMSPERLMGDPDKPAGDVFALGITLYELLRLKSFGKIYIREEKFENALDERIGGLDLGDLAADRAIQVRSALRLLLAYDAEQRPSAAQVVELMEALADEVQDGSIRRFCREVVLPCHQAMEYPDNPDDPFMGSTLFEDTTRVREDLAENSGLQALNVGPAPTLESVPTVQSTPTSAPKVGQVVTSDALRTISRDKVESTTQDDLAVPAPLTDLPTQESPRSETTTGSLPDPPTDIGDSQLLARNNAGASAQAAEPEAATDRTGLIVGIVVALVVIVLGSGGLVAWKFLQPQPGTTGVQVPQTRTYSPGGEVDGGFEGKVGTLVLGLQNASDARVTISGNQNDFSYRWNGREVLTINNLEPGLYRIRILNSDARVNLESQVIRRRTCTYEYNLSSGKQAWNEDGCS